MSKCTPHTIPLGDATITIVNVGDMMVDMAQEIAAPESAWRIPEKAPVEETRKVLMPTTSPCAFTSGPPELPGLMAASV